MVSSSSTVSSLIVELVESVALVDLLLGLLIIFVKKSH